LLIVSFWDVGLLPKQIGVKSIERAVDWRVGFHTPARENCSFNRHYQVFTISVDVRRCHIMLIRSGQEGLSAIRPMSMLRILVQEQPDNDIGHAGNHTHGERRDAP
jgi:hypothetical protein